jgi:hypothetical protein
LRLWFLCFPSGNQEKLTKLSYRQELERFLSYGKWDLTDDDIERINKDEENRQRVSIVTRAHMTGWFAFFTAVENRSGFGDGNEWLSMIGRPLTGYVDFVREGRELLFLIFWGLFFRFETF